MNLFLGFHNCWLLFVLYFDRVEQELMAKVISEVYIKKQDAVPHTPLTARVDREHREESDIESEISQLSSHESFIGD